MPKALSLGVFWLKINFCLPCCIIKLYYLNQEVAPTNLLTEFKQLCESIMTITSLKKKDRVSFTHNGANLFGVVVKGGRGKVEASIDSTNRIIKAAAPFFTQSDSPLPSFDKCHADRFFTATIKQSKTPSRSGYPTVYTFIASNKVLFTITDKADGSMFEVDYKDGSDKKSFDVYHSFVREWVKHHLDLTENNLALINNNDENHIHLVLCGFAEWCQDYSWTGSTPALMMPIIYQYFFE